MATRSLTEVFTQLRINAIQDRNFYHEEELSDRVNLVEQGSGGRNGDGDSSIPPRWVDQLQDAQYAISTLQKKIQKLQNLNKKNVHRPTLDDSSFEQEQIENLTSEISRMFLNCHKVMGRIRKESYVGTILEKRLAENALSSLATSLQNASNDFKSTQYNYLRTLQSREERSKQYFDSAMEQDFDTWEVDRDIENIDRVFGLDPSLSKTQQQLLLIEEENTKMVADREKEVRQIVKSIVDLNIIFKDLSEMVIDQGTVLDRIDYNIERTSVQVHQGYTQLQKADRYQKRNRKMTCIICMAVTTFVMLILLIIIKF